MPALLKTIAGSVMIVILFTALLVSKAHSDIVVFDQITTLNTPIYLKALTKGRFFAAGGKRVEIFVENKKLKQILTGGDGYGFLKYTPQRLGAIKIEARSEGYRDTGTLLVVAKNENVMLIDVEGAFKNSLFSEQVRVDSRRSVEALSKRYKIVYLNTFLGIGLSRSLLQREKFPESVTLKWKGTGLLKALKNRGIHLHAIIGSAAVVAEAKKYIEHRYSFEETKDGKTVQDWEEMLEVIEEDAREKPSEPESSQE
jgi:hypothetical protein